MLKKIALFPVLLALGCLISGAYGAIHNQISYTVSPDYFDGFKFDQFAIPEGLRNRWGASVVGWLASWWMGLIIGVPILLVGLIMPDRKTYLTRCLAAFGVVAATALIVGLLALGGASYAITEESFPPTHLDLLGPGRRVAFARAGTMHNFSYIGGFLGILSGSIYLVAARAGLSRRLPAYHVKPETFRMAIGWGLLMAGPFFVATPYLFASHFIGFLNRFPVVCIALALCEAVGLCGVALLTFPRWLRAVLAVVYVPLIAILLVGYSFSFLELVFGFEP